MDKLDIELDGIPDIDMDAFGFDVDIDCDTDVQPNPNLQEDGFCDDDVSQRASRGDVWILGSHRLMCGDSTSADPHYADVIIDRWEKFTGMKAEKAEV